MICKYNRVFFYPDDTVLGGSEAEDTGIPPKTRYENFWALLAGDPNAVEMEPKTKEEYYMSKLNERIAALEDAELNLGSPSTEELNTGALGG